MSPLANTQSPGNPEASVKNILEWLALAHGRSGAEDAEQLHLHLLALRDTPLPSAQRLKLLDLLYSQAERVAKSEITGLRKVTLPISRKIRIRLKSVLDLLATLTQDYFNTLAELFDPAAPEAVKTPHNSLRRAMHAITWQLNLTQLIAAPSPVGLWQQLHAAFRNAHRLGVEDIPAPGNGRCIRRIYTDTLLAGIVQPISFTASELDFIASYIANCTPAIELLPTPPLDDQGIFWIDTDKDFPGNALIRRIPGAEAAVLYFSCDMVAKLALRHHDELLKGMPAELLGLPKAANSRIAPGLLLRLHRLWGSPSKRRFPRRRQSYRAFLCPGLGNLWQLIKSPSHPCNLSEWMVTNESPNGFALMHMAGHTANLTVGDIVALQATEERAEASPLWHICIIRWAVSENPEHIEIGLQILASKALAVEVANPFRLNSAKVASLMLPATPPLQPLQSLITPTGMIDLDAQRLVILSEDGNLSVRELRPTQLLEQSSSIEIFSVAPDDSQ